MASSYRRKRVSTVVSTAVIVSIFWLYVFLIFFARKFTIELPQATSKTYQSYVQTPASDCQCTTQPPDMAIPDFERMANLYAFYFNKFHNKADYTVIPHFLKSHPLCTSLSVYSRPPTLFIVGANKGEDIVKHIQSCANLVVYGFEGVKSVFQILESNTRDYANVHRIEAIVSKDSEEKTIRSDGGGAGGVYKDNFKGNANEVRKLNAVTWGNFVAKNNISSVDFAIIDVEGHEIEVLLGMKLTQNRNVFPVIMIELGGTWQDHRHTSIWTQGDLARYLISLGYRIYLMAQIPEHPPGSALFEVHPRLFDQCNTLRGDGPTGPYPWFVQGNILAIYWEGVQPKLVRDGVRRIVQAMESRMFSFEDFKQAHGTDGVKCHVFSPPSCFA